MMLLMFSSIFEKRVLQEKNNTIAVSFTTGMMSTSPTECGTTFSPSS